LKPAPGAAQRRAHAEREPSPRVAREGQALDPAPLVPQAVQDHVAVGGKRIQPLQLRPLVHGADAVQLGDDAGRIAREGFVVRLLERVAAIAGKDARVARKRLAVEVQADHQQAATSEGGAEGLAGEAAVGFVAGERAALLAFPPAGLELHQFFHPALDRVAGSQRNVRHRAALRQAALAAAHFLAVLARHRARDVGIGIAGAPEQRALIAFAHLGGGQHHRRPAQCGSPRGCLVRHA